MFMGSAMQRQNSNDEAATMLEMAVVIALVALVAIAGVSNVGERISARFTSVADKTMECAAAQGGIGCGEPTNQGRRGRR